MTLANALSALADSWDDVVARLDAPQRTHLVDLTGELLRSAGPARREVSLDLMEFLATALPPEHPVRRAFAAETKKFEFGPAVDQWIPALQHQLDATAALLLGSPGPAAAAADPSGPIRQAAEDFLLSAPALAAEQARRNGVDPGGADLIRLRFRDGSTRLPAFQFDRYGRPRPVVGAINRLLDADDDPWGVADWWLGLNARIDAIPAEMIGRLADEVLIEVAQAVLEEG